MEATGTAQAQRTEIPDAVLRTDCERILSHRFVPTESFAITEIS